MKVLTTMHTMTDLESVFQCFFHKNVATHFQAGLGKLRKLGLPKISQCSKTESPYIISSLEPK